MRVDTCSSVRSRRVLNCQRRPKSRAPAGTAPLNHAALRRSIANVAQNARGVAARVVQRNARASRHRPIASGMRAVGADDRVAVAAICLARQRPRDKVVDDAELLDRVADLAQHGVGPLGLRSRVLRAAPAAAGREPRSAPARSSVCLSAAAQGRLSAGSEPAQAQSYCGCGDPQFVGLARGMGRGPSKAPWPPGGA
jgi:hypothetical protein